MDSPDEVLSTDACLAGCGGACDDQYFHGVSPPFIFEQNLYIRSLEVLTIVVALKLWGTCWTGLSITVLCDNKAAVAVVNTGRCGNHFMNSCLNDICYFATLYEFEVCAVQVPGVSNHFADLLSRWDSYNAFSAIDIIGKTLPFLMRCSGLTVHSKSGPSLSQVSANSAVFDRISSTRSALHNVLELSVT